MSEGLSVSSSVHGISEFELIKRIAGKTKKNDRSVIVGIGDDAAVIDVGAWPASSQKKQTNRLSPLLITTDSLIEDVHFRRDYPPDDLGWKALAVNISDIAAMGGVPEYYLLSLGIPEGISIGYIDRFIEGLTDISREYGLSLVGGDTTSSPDRFYISITLFGKGGDKVLLRNGAKGGDVIFVTGTIGDSALGLKILEEKSGVKSAFSAAEDVEMLINRHLRPTPRVDEGIQLANSGLVTSMIDISDGLLGDLGHVCEESGVGARINMEAIPVSHGFNYISAKYGGRELALSGGEDYELLFTVKKKDAMNLMGLTGGVKYTPIGEILKERMVEVIGADGKRYLPKSRGYDHFKR